MNKEDIERQHLNAYKHALKELVLNNTTSLLSDDFKIIFSKPPLDSMDTLKSKFLSSAKKNKLVLNNDLVDDTLDIYRNKILKELEIFKSERINKLEEMIDSFKQENSTDTFILYKNKLDLINKNIYKKVKEILENIIDVELIKKVETISDNQKFIDEVTKFLKSDYTKQVMEDIKFKVLIKDMTLINGIKSQGERYLFTRENSHLYDE